MTAPTGWFEREFRNGGPQGLPFLAHATEPSATDEEAGNENREGSDDSEERGCVAEGRGDFSHVCICILTTDFGFAAKVRGTSRRFALFRSPRRRACGRGNC